MPTLQPPSHSQTIATSQRAATPGGDGGERYGPVAVLLHWLVAVAVVAQVVLGIWMTGLPDTPRGLQAGRFNLHKSAGIVLFALIVLRLAWRARQAPPPWPRMPAVGAERESARLAADRQRGPAGEFANGLAMHPGGHELYVSNGRGGSVSVIDVPAQAVVATIAVGKRPWNMALTRDGGKPYVANGRSDSVSVIDTARRAKLADVAVGKLPWGVVMR
jgi:YVTN family beta-propeller protein